MYRQPPPADPPKKTSTGRIVAIVSGALVLALLLVASAVYKVLDTKRALDDGFIAEAGPPMSDAEIRAALAGPKKDFVGHWRSVSGNALLNIEADGRMSYSAQRGMARESSNGRITSFTDEAFYATMFRFAIEQPPQRGPNGKWTMRVRSQTFERD